MANFLNAFKRRPKNILPSLVEKGNMTICGENLYVLFPARYKVKNMCTIDNVVYVAAYVMLYNDKNEYCVMSMPNLLRLLPEDIDEIDIEDVKYIKLTFKKGDIFTDNNEVVQLENFLYYVFDEFFALGKTPFFFDKDDTSDIYKQAGPYAGSRLGDGVLGLESITSVILRDADDKELDYRLTDKLKPPVNIGLSDVHYTFKTNLNKINAANMTQGVGKAVITPPSNRSSLEDVLAD